MPPESPLSVTHVQTGAALASPLRVTPKAAAAPVEERAADPAPSAPNSERLVVEVDADAGRFVQKIVDPSTLETLRQYPSEGQLAFSRALRAYLSTLRI